MLSLWQNIQTSLRISIYVFAMLILTDYLNVITKGKIATFLQKKSWYQYLVASLLGATPGCIGAFLSVSLYMHGIISAGAILGSMIATTGDEAFLMLALFPIKALALFLLLFLLGIAFAFLSDRITASLKIKFAPCPLSKIHLQQECQMISFSQIWQNLKNLYWQKVICIFLIIILSYLSIVGYDQALWELFIISFLTIFSIIVILSASKHYLHDHILNHLIKKHLLRIFLWSSISLIIIEYGIKTWQLNHFINTHTYTVLLFALLFGIIPSSGPHMIFVFGYAKGIIPFSILLTSSLSQNGHAMLALLSYDFKRALFIKSLNLIIGLLIGSFFYLLLG